MSKIHELTTKFPFVFLRKLKMLFKGNILIPVRMNTTVWCLVGYRSGTLHSLHKSWRWTKSATEFLGNTITSVPLLTCGISWSQENKVTLLALFLHHWARWVFLSVLYSPPHYHHHPSHFSFRGIICSTSYWWCIFIIHWQFVVYSRNRHDLITISV